jgi:hypothetical protein
LRNQSIICKSLNHPIREFANELRLHQNPLKRQMFPIFHILYGARTPGLVEKMRSAMLMGQKDESFFSLYPAAVGDPARAADPVKKF